MDTVLLLVNIIFVLSGALALLFAGLVVKKWHNNRRTAQKEQFKAAHRGRVFTHITTGEPLNEKVLQSADTYDGLAEILISYSAVLKGDDFERVTRFAEGHLTDYYRKCLRSSNWGTRMNALYGIEQLRMSTLSEELATLWERRKQTEAEAIQLLKIAADAQQEKLLAYLQTLPHELPSFYYQTIFNRLQEPLFTRLLADSDHYTSRVRYALIDVIGAQKRLTHAERLIAFAQAEDAETRIRALKALSKLEYLPDVRIVTRAVRSEVWEERLFAAKLLATVNDKESQLLLNRLANDACWHVRQVATDVLDKQARTNQRQAEESREARQRLTV